MIAVNRRKFLGAGAGGMGLLGLAGAMPAWARGADILAGNARKGLDEISGPSIDLTVARSAFATGNRRGGANQTSRPRAPAARRSTSMRHTAPLRKAGPRPWPQRSRALFSTGGRCE